MKRIAIVLSLLLSCLPASAQQTQSNVQALINAKVLPNGKQAITGAVLNGVLTTMNAATFQTQPFNFLTNSSLNLDAWEASVPSGHSSYQQQLQLNSAAFAPIGFGGLYSFGAINVAGYQAFLGYSHTAALANPVGAQSTAGGYFVAQNDVLPVSPLPGAYGVYTECRVSNGGFCAGIESDVETTITGARVPTPNNIFGTTSGPLGFGQWIYLGGSQAPYAPYNSSAAIGVSGTSGSHFNKGIVFSNNSIDGGSGDYEAINLAKNYEIDWYGTTDATVGRLYSDGTNLYSSMNFSINGGGVVLDGINQLLQFGDITTLNRNSSTGTLTISTNAGDINLNPKGNLTIGSGATIGVSCSGSPTSSFASVNGIVTHC